MNEKDILKKLNDLRVVDPGENWKENNRRILLNQIGKSSEGGKPAGFFAVLFQLPPFSYAKSLPRPAMAVFMAALFIFGGGLYSLGASKNSKPGDSLYIAKIVGEKTQLAFTFNEKNKARLNLEFAENRARELSQVLAGEENDNEGKKEKVEKLVVDFKKEINDAKTRVKKMSRSTGFETANKQEEKEDQAGEGGEAGEDSHIFSANMDKDNRGIQVSEGRPRNGDEIPASGRAENTGEKGDTATTAPEKASTTVEKKAETADENKSDMKEILAEAKEMLDSDDYSGIISKLEQAGQSIENVEGGQVKGENASSSSAVFEEAKDQPEKATSTDVQ